MRFDRDALLTGAAIATLVAAPLGIAAAVRGGSGVLTALILAGLGLGATVAATRQQSGAPLAHGIAAAVLSFAVVQFVGIVRRATAGEDIAWNRILSSLTLTAVVGMLGGMLGGLITTRRARRAGGSS